MEDTPPPKLLERKFLSLTHLESNYLLDKDVVGFLGEISAVALGFGET